MSQPTTGIYLNSQTPAAPSGNQNVKFVSDGATPQQSVTAYLQKATSSLLGVMKPDGTTLTVASDGTVSVNTLTFTFGLVSGSVGTNVARRELAPRAGHVSECAVVVEASDNSTALTFRIKQNGTDVFSSDPSIAAATTAGSVSYFTNLTSSPLSVAKNDIFTLDVTSGSATWSVTVYLRT